MPIQQNGSAGAGGSSQGFVAKTGRHLQLINSSIYEKDSQTRSKAIEQTRKLKLKQRDEREKTKLHNHIQRIGSAITGESASSSYETEIQGIKFRVTKDGSKLAKIPGEKIKWHFQAIIGRSSSYTGDLNAAKSTPKTAMVGGVRFYRTKNGNMYRSGIVKAYQ